MVFLGQIYVGIPSDALQPGESNPSLYVFKQNAASGSLPVFLKLNDPTSTVAGDVNVTCTSASQDVVGDTQVSFKHAVLNSSKLYGEVKFDILAPGREVPLSCHGESTEVDTETGRKFEFNSSASSNR